MIILPDKSIVRTKMLMPVPDREWRTPSHAQQKTFCGDEDRVSFSLIARLSDGHVIWRGNFEDRYDVDAFLYAVVTGSLNYERELWKLPTPYWDGYGIDNVVFQLLVSVTLTTVGTANTYTVPSDWSNSSNTIHCIGAGASGGVTRKSGAPRLATGGGGGGYGKTTNMSLTAGGSITYGIGAGGAFVRLSTAGNISGNAGGDTYFNAVSYAAAAVGGQGGSAGISSGSAVTINGGAGGAGKGSTNYSGGAGGNITVTSATSTQSTGGGGAAGPNGAGNNGNVIDAAGNFYSLGGAGDAGFGGLPVSSNGASGGSGAEFGTVGSGAGGTGGGSVIGSITGGSGGAYGGAGAAACGPGTITSGTGSQGLIFIQYTPTIGVFSFNLAMMGM